MITIFLEDLISVIVVLGFIILLLLILTGKKLRVWWL